MPSTNTTPRTNIVTALKVPGIDDSGRRWPIGDVRLAVDSLLCCRRAGLKRNVWVESVAYIFFCLDDVRFAPTTDFLRSHSEPPPRRSLLGASKTTRLAAVNAVAKCSSSASRLEVLDAKASLHSRTEAHNGETLLALFDL